MNYWQFTYLAIIVFIVFISGRLILYFFSKQIGEHYEKNRLDKEVKKADSETSQGHGKAFLQKFRNNLKNSGNGRRPE